MAPGKTSMPIQTSRSVILPSDVLPSSSSHWPMRFETGERQMRRANNEWPGNHLATAAALKAEKTPETIAIIEGSFSLDYATCLSRARDMARGLREVGIAPGDTVSFQLPNWAEAVIINIACALGGFVINPVIPIYRQAELSFILKDCKARIAFIPDVWKSLDYREIYGQLAAELPALAHVVTVRGEGDLTFEAIEALGRASDIELQHADPDNAKLIIYTSGTTGQPKGVIYSHNQAARPIWASMAAWSLEAADTLLMPSPVTHVTGYAYGMEMPFHFGTRTVFMERWDAAQAIALVREHGVNFMIGATPFLAELVTQAEKEHDRLETLRIYACG